MPVEVVHSTTLNVYPILSLPSRGRGGEGDEGQMSAVTRLEKLRKEEMREKKKHNGPCVVYFFFFFWEKIIVGIGFYVMVMDCSHSGDLVLLYGSTQFGHMNTNSHLIAMELVLMATRHVLTMRFFFAPVHMPAWS